MLSLVINPLSALPEIITWWEVIQRVWVFLNLWTGRIERRSSDWARTLPPVVRIDRLGTLVVRLGCAREVGRHPLGLSFLVCCWEVAVGQAGSLSFAPPPPSHLDSTSTSLSAIGCHAQTRRLPVCLLSADQARRRALWQALATIWSEKSRYFCWDYPQTHHMLLIGTHAMQIPFDASCRMWRHAGG